MSTGPTPPAPTPAPTVSDKIHGAIDAAGSWIVQEKDTLAHAVATAGLPKPVADLVAAIEEALAGLPAALAAGEKSIADELTPEHIAALADAVSQVAAQVVATLVKQFLARIPATVAVAATTV